MMAKLTPLLQPLSIDEAVLDLAGTEALHGAPPAVVLARFARRGRSRGRRDRVDRARAEPAAGEDRRRPQQAARVRGDRRVEARALLAPEPVRLLPGIGPALAHRLAAQGITLLGHLQALNDREARRRIGEDGPSLVRRARGEDARRIDPERETKSISAETTFATDLTRPAIWRRISGGCRRSWRGG